MGLWPFYICAAFCSYDVGAGAGGVVLPAFSLGIVGRGQRPAAQVKGSNRSGQEAVDKRGELLSLRQPRFAHGNHKAQTNLEGTP